MWTGIKSRLLGAYLTVRLGLRRFGVALPARTGWAELVRTVRDTDGVYQEPGLIGAPHAWSLFVPVPGQASIPYEAVCIDTGKEINARNGVRCARCGVPVAIEVAHILSDFHPPSCRTCVRAVASAWRTR